MTQREFEVVERYFVDLQSRLSRLEDRLAWALPSETDIEDQIDFSIDRALNDAWRN